MVSRAREIPSGNSLSRLIGTIGHRGRSWNIGTHQKEERRVRARAQGVIFKQHSGGGDEFMM